MKPNRDMQPFAESLSQPVEALECMFLGPFKIKIHDERENRWKGAWVMLRS